MSEDSLVTAALQYWGRVVYQRRRALGWTQEELGAKVGLGRSAICQLELGNQQLQFARFIRIAHVLGITPQQQLPPEGNATYQEIMQLLLAAPDEELQAHLTIFRALYGPLRRERVYPACVPVPQPVCQTA